MTGKYMKHLSRAAILGVLLLSVGCATGPYGKPLYQSSSSAPILGALDRAYVLHIDDQTYLGLDHLPGSMDLLYESGYDQVRHEMDAHFAIDIYFRTESREDMQLRTWNAFSGALMGATLGAIIGGSGTSAALGAASGGLLGAVLPTPSTDLVRIDIQVHSFTRGRGSYMSAVVDLASLPYFEVPYAVDHHVARMLSRLPRR